jgi:hypothetical protein
LLMPSRASKAHTAANLSNNASSAEDGEAIRILTRPRRAAGCTATLLRKPSSDRRVGLEYKIESLGSQTFSAVQWDIPELSPACPFQSTIPPAGGKETCYLSARYGGHR